MDDFYSEGGWTMYPTTLFGMLAVISSIILAARPERRFVPLVLSLDALTLFTGFLGTMWGLTGVVKSVANADAAGQQELIIGCATQALSSLLLACALVCLAILCAASGALRLATTRPVRSVAGLSP